jgi:hypothetical protein
MTVVSLFDVLQQQDEAPMSSDPRLAELAGRMVHALRDDYGRLRQYEQDFGDVPDDDDAAELELLRCIWRLFDEWAQEAEQVLARAGRLEAVGLAVAQVAELRDDYGLARARLSNTPEQIIRSKQQARGGDVISAKELRDELRARVHP